MANQTETTETGLREQAVEYTLAANPLVGIRDHELYDASFKLFEQVMSHPAVAAKHYMSYLGELGRIAAGGSELAPDAKDKRFSDAVWKDSVCWRALVQGYLAWSNALYGFVDDAKMEKLDAERARFIISLLVDAMAPTNTVAGNPAALRKCVDTGGASLLHGFKNFAGDLVQNGGLPTQVDTSKIE